jgi:general secretion pathway protein M
MIETLSARQRRLLALLILAILIVLVFSLTLLPLWSTHRHYAQTIAELQNRTEIIERMVAAGTGLQSRHQQLRQTQAADRHYLKNETDALAAAELQRLVKRIAVAKKMEVLSIQILPAAQEQGFTRIALKVHMRGTLDSIVQLFYALETGEPLLFMEDMSLRSHARRSRGMGAVEQSLETDFNLVAYVPRQS